MKPYKLVLSLPLLCVTREQLCKTIPYHLPVRGGKTQQTWPDHCLIILSGNWPGFIFSILNCFSSGKQIAKRFSEEPKKLTIWKCVNVGGRLEISFLGEPTYDNWSTRRCTVTTIRSAGGLFLSRMGEALEMISSGMSLVLFLCQLGLNILVVKVAR